jgi:hypothetical protein
VTRDEWEAQERERMREMSLAEAVAILARKPERKERRDGRWSSTPWTRSGAGK